MEQTLHLMSTAKGAIEGSVRAAPYLGSKSSLTCKSTEQLPRVLFTVASRGDLNSCAERFCVHRGRACLQQEVDGGHSQAHRAQALCSLWSPPYSERHLWWQTGGILLQLLSLPAGQSPGAAQSLCILRTHQRSPRGVPAGTWAAPQ